MHHLLYSHEKWLSFACTSKNSVCYWSKMLLLKYKFIEYKLSRGTHPISLISEHNCFTESLRTEAYQKCRHSPARLLIYAVQLLEGPRLSTNLTRSRDIASYVIFSAPDIWEYLFWLLSKQPVQKKWVHFPQLLSSTIFLVWTYLIGKTVTFNKWFHSKKTKLSFCTLGRNRSRTQPQRSRCCPENLKCCQVKRSWRSRILQSHCVCNLVDAF